MAISERLGERVRGRDNAFDVLRLLGAALVLVSHSYALVGLEEPGIGNISLGALGVEIFFAISGFLIAASWLSEPRIRPFLAKRGLRILPALFVTVLLSAFVLGPLMTDASLRDYFMSSGPMAYIVQNMAAVMTAGTGMGINYDLPSLFLGHPSEAVNGSLWTLPVEVKAYYLVMLLGLTGILLRALWVPVMAGLVLLLFAGGESEVLLVLFFASALLYVHRERVPLHRALALGACAAWIVGMLLPEGGALIVLGAPYTVLYVAYRAPARVRVLTARGDVSYGLYLLAFPIQQVFVHLLPGLEPLVLIAISLPLTYVAATLSWQFVERPALRLKGAVAGRPRRASHVAMPLKPVHANATKV
jgi:peptidoglycan/LPS O-acetylase OafA/YrhL